MATTYQLRTFADIVDAVREELGVQSSDTVTINRIKRDINTIYLEEVVPAARWKWLLEQLPIIKEAKYDSGTAAVTQNSVAITLSTVPTLNFSGYWLSIKGENNRYRIKSHTENTSAVVLETEYLGVTNASARFIIWRDTIDLPANCNEVVEVTHDFRSTPLDNQGWQEFTKRAAVSYLEEGKPSRYTTSDYINLVPSESISSLPSIVSRSSSGLLKTVVFSATLGTVSSTQLLKEGVHITVTGAGHYSFNTEDAIVANISQTNVANDTIQYVGTAKRFESLTADTGIVVKKFVEGREGKRIRQMTLHPAIDSARINLHVSYKREVEPLVNDNDEPAMPIEWRVVLRYGALWLGWRKQRNPEESAANEQTFRMKLAEMKGKWEDSLEKGQIKVNNDYLTRQRRTARSLSGYFSGGGGGASSSSSPQSTPNSAAIFDADGYLTAAPLVSTTELSYLDNATSNIQDQLDAITDLTDYLVDTEELQSVTLVDNTASATNVAQWAAASYDTVKIEYSIKRGSARENGHINITTDGSSAAIAQGVIASLGSTGVTLTADVSGGNVRLRYTTTNTGSNGVIKYKLHKWLS